MTTQAESGVGKWIGGVAATVVAGLLLAYLTNWFGIGGPPNRPVVHVEALSTTGLVSYDTTPVAQIYVGNQGKMTAESCVVVWSPGVKGVLGTPVVVRSYPFPIAGEKETSVTLRSPQAYLFRGKTTSTASVQCSNAQSDPVSVTVSVY